MCMWFEHCRKLKKSTLWTLSFFGIQVLYAVSRYFVASQIYAMSGYFVSETPPPILFLFLSFAGILFLKIIKHNLQFAAGHNFKFYYSFKNNK